VAASVAPPPPAPRSAAAPAASNAATVKAVEARREQAKAAAPASAAPEPRAPRSAPAPESAPAAAPITDPAALKTAFLAGVEKAKRFFYGTVLAQAQRIDVEADRIVLAFGPQHKALRTQVDPVRPILEDIASQLAGRRMSVVAVEIAAVAAGASDAPTQAAPGADRQSQLRQQALSDKSVQAMLDVFGTEIKEVEER
jgi:hypothetical protein